jgi:type VII secretion effector (TIGR04197 family)
MKRAVLIVAMIGAGGAYLLSGCSDANKARIDVAKKKVLDRIDDALGKMDVQKAEIDNGIKSAKQAADGVRRAKVRAQVNLDQINEKVRPFEERISQCDQTLMKLRDALAANMPATIGGKTYSVDDLKDMAGKVIAARKDAETQINGFKSAREAMTKQVALLTKTQQGIETKIATLQSQMAKLDSEIVAAKAMKQSSAAMGDGDSSLAENLNELERKIAALSADAQSELALETDRWSAANAEKAISDVDAFIRDSQKSGDTVAEIDRILGGKK